VPRETIEERNAETTVSSNYSAGNAGWFAYIKRIGHMGEIHPETRAVE
jgi:hypothetical protein